MELAEQLISSVSLPLKLILGIVFFAPLLKRRKNFLLRVLLCVIVILGASLASYKPLGDYRIAYLLYLIQLAMVGGAMLLCFNVSIIQVLFVLGTTLALQQIAFNVITVIYISIFSSRFDQSGAVPGMEILSLLIHFVHIGFVALVYFVFTKIVFKRYNITEETVVKNKAVIFVAFSLTVLLFVMFHIVFLLCPSALIFVLMYIITGISCMLAVGYFMSIFNKEKLDADMEVMQKVLKESSRQHGIFKENIDIINRKCHDMKYMLSSIADGNHGAYIDEIKQAVDIYGAMPKTGNAVLDVVLSENYLRAKEAGVDMSCIADGTVLDFIDEADLYALFGNAISNALEAATTAEERVRFINLYVGLSTGLIRISIENGYSGELHFKNGLPLTTKGDESYHGFGMKSIEFIVRKYGGGLDISAENGIFKLSIVLEPQASTGEHAD